MEDREIYPEKMDHEKSSFQGEMQGNKQTIKWRFKMIIDYN